MSRPFRRSEFLVLPLILCGIVAAASDNWLQVSSQHFTVFCDGNEKQARHIADQLERMRLVFRADFPDMQVDPAVPIVVIAVKDTKEFRTLEPEAYLAKGQLELSGLFLRAPDKNYVLLRMDAGGPHPYAAVYHEYTHLIFSKAEDWLPLWLNEGLAEFYQNTEIREKETILGEATAEDMLWLRQKRLLPLTTLFAVDHNSPYYHEEQKASIFYSEAWALTHYLKIKDADNNTHRIMDYAILLSNHVDSVTAATRAFGDLKQLQAALESYIGQAVFKAFKLTKTLEPGDSNLKAQPITPSQAEAVRADFLAYNQREKDARALLDEVLKTDPNNTLAHETMGYMEFRAGHGQQAENWYAQAVKLDSQNFLANYYFASIAMNRESPGNDIDAQIESSLQKAIKLNPSFAPSYDRLAVFYTMRHKDLDQAHLCSLQAVQLDPTNVYFRVNTANILLTMQRENDALTVLQNAVKLARNPAEVATVQAAIANAQQAQSMRQQQQEQARRFHEEIEAAAKQNPAESPNPPVASQKEAKEIVLQGPHRNVTGTIENVVCAPSAAMDIDVVAGSKKITLHAANYYTIQFTALGFTPNSELVPCTDLEGAHAKVEYIESSETKVNGVIAIELHK